MIRRWWSRLDRVDRIFFPTWAVLAAVAVICFAIAVWLGES